MVAMANVYSYMTSAELAALRAGCIEALTTLASRTASSYTLNGRSWTARDIPQLEKMLGNVCAAQAEAAGTSTDTTFVNFTGL